MPTSASPGAEVDEPRSRVDIELDIGMKFLEAPKARHQPARGDGRLDRDIEGAYLALRGGFAGCVRKCVEQGCQTAPEAAPGFSQFDAAAGAQK